MTVASMFLPNSVGARLAPSDTIPNRRVPRTVDTSQEHDPFGPEVLHDLMHPSGAVFVGSTPYVCADVADFYSTHSGKVTSCYESLEDALELGSLLDEPRFFLIDIDSFSLSDVIGQLFDFRIRNPKHVVVLLSHDFAHDDFTTSRKSIADASLKLPLSRTRLLCGMGFARRNNKYTVT